ncbi:nuclease-related domain-containing protein [Nocardia sp. NPDC023988]|uniref:nuclease-related domain-containing protein n=1 Tax=unclassified Nocardia TaxID=2637762 RepID=UPI0033F9429E
MRETGLTNPRGRSIGEVVVLLLVDPDSELSSAEERFADWVEWSPAQSGVVLLDVNVPYRGHSRQLDALLFTRQRCIAVEVKGFRSVQHGTLIIPPNGPWVLDDGEVADIYGNDYDHDPVSQVRANSSAVKNWATSATRRPCFVWGLVVVMLLPGQDVPSLQVDAHPEKTDIIVEDFDVFRYYLHRLDDQKVQWDADRVHTLLTRLGVAHRYGGRREAIAAALGEPVYLDDGVPGATPLRRY